MYIIFIKSIFCKGNVTTVITVKTNIFIGYIASLVVWLVFMVKPSNEGANKFGEPAEIKELSSFSIKAE